MPLISKNRIFMIGSVAAAALTLGMTGCEEKDKQEQPHQAMAVPVDVTTVKLLDVPVVSRLTGRANPTRKAEVRPQVSGVIQKRLFTEGAMVTQGEQLYQIDPALYEADVASAEAALASANATLHSTQLKATRYANLLKTKAVSQQDYDDANAAYLSAKAEVERAKASLQTAEINLAYTKVYAPISGTISRSNVTEGALVSAQQTSPMTTIQQLDPIYVDLGQTVEDNLQLRQKAAEGKLHNKDGKTTVDIYLTDGSKYPYQGTLEFAEVSVDETTGMVNLRALVPNPEHLLLPSMFLRGVINEGIIPDVPVISAVAVMREFTGASYVYLIDENNIVQRVDIQLGNQYGDGYVVIDGIKAGDRVVTSNIQKIRTGVQVQIVGTNGQPESGPEGAPGSEQSQAAPDAAPVKGEEPQGNQ